MVADVTDDEFVRKVVGTGRAASTTTGRHLERRIATDGAGGAVDSVATDGPWPPSLSLARSLARSFVRSFGSVRSLVRLVLPHRRSCRRRCRLLLPSPIPSAPGPAACVASVATATHTAVYGNAVTGSRSSRTSAHLPVSSSTRLQSHIDDDKIFIRFLIAVFRELINDYSFLFFFYI